MQNIKQAFTEKFDTPMGVVFDIDELEFVASFSRFADVAYMYQKMFEAFQAGVEIGSERNQ